MAQNGIHHVTAIAGPARRNLDFYTRMLGLRLVKKTVNFDDPGTYHFYYGDETGQPGTILTFFPWEHVAPGPARRRRDAGDGVPRAGGLRSATGRTASSRKASRTRPSRSASARPCSRSRTRTACGLRSSPCPASRASRRGAAARCRPSMRSAGFHSVSLLLREAAPTGAILTDVFGFAEVGREGSTVRFKADGTAIGGIVDIRVAGDFLPRPAGRRLGPPHRVPRGRRRGGSSR